MMYDAILTFTWYARQPNLEPSDEMSSIEIHDTYDWPTLSWNWRSSEEIHFIIATQWQKLQCFIQKVHKQQKKTKKKGEGGLETRNPSDDNHYKNHKRKLVSSHHLNTSHSNSTCYRQECFNLCTSKDQYLKVIRSSPLLKHIQR